MGTDEGGRDLRRAYTCECRIGLTKLNTDARDRSEPAQAQAPSKPLRHRTAIRGFGPVGMLDAQSKCAILNDDVQMTVEAAPG